MSSHFQEVFSLHVSASAGVADAATDGTEHIGEQHRQPAHDN